MRGKSTPPLPDCEDEGKRSWRQHTCREMLQFDLVAPALRPSCDRPITANSRARPQRRGAPTFLCPKFYAFSSAISTARIKVKSHWKKIVTAKPSRELCSFRKCRILSRRRNRNSSD